MSPVPHRGVAAALLTALVLIASPASAQEQAPFDFAGDRYAAGAAPELGTAPRDAIFAAGETVRSAASASRSVHLAGRVVEQSGEVGGSVYAAGQRVRLSGAAQGDASLAGQDVTVAAPVGGTVRALGQRVEIDAPAGALLVAAETVRLNAEISGDAWIMVERLELGPEARIGGTLTLGAETAPPLDGVAAGGVERVAYEVAEMRAPGVMAVIFGVLWGVVAGALVVLAAQAVALGAAPGWTEGLAFDVMERPFRSFGAGFLAVAALIGAIPLAAATLIGLPVAALALAFVPVALLFGYALGVWTLGAAVWRAVDRPAPESFGRRMLVGLAGLVAAALLSLIPFFGWMTTVVLTLIGAGAASARLLRGRAAA